MALRNQSVQPWEVVISDDSDDAMKPAVRGLAQQFDCVYVDGPRRGLYANRNHAALACQGTHIRTMDDDHTFPEGHFDACDSAIRRDPLAIWTIGETCYVDGAFYSKAETAPELNPSGVGGIVTKLDDNWSISDGATIYPAEVFSRGYCMCDYFSYGQSYLEFGAFLYARGFRSRCMRETHVIHWATQATLDRSASPSQLLGVIYAAICYNLHFKRNLPSAAYHVGKLVLKRWWDVQMIRELPVILSVANRRWSQS